MGQGPEKFPSTASSWTRSWPLPGPPATPPQAPCCPFLAQPTQSPRAVTRCWTRVVSPSPDQITAPRGRRRTRHHSTPSPERVGDRECPLTITLLGLGPFSQSKREVGQGTREPHIQEELDQVVSLQKPLLLLPKYGINTPVPFICKGRRSCPKRPRILCMSFLSALESAIFFGLN